MLFHKPEEWVIYWYLVGPFDPDLKGLNTKKALLLLTPPIITRNFACITKCIIFFRVELP